MQATTSTPELPDEKVAVFGVYPGTEQTESGVQALIEAGFSTLDIKASAIEPVPVSSVLTPAVVDCEPQATVTDAVGTAARMAGSMLALGTVPLLAPMLVAGPVLGAILGRSGMTEMPREEMTAEPDKGVLVSINCVDRKAAKRATKVLETTGAQDLAVAELQGDPGDDLKSREYRDERGEVHHHTRTYMQDHDGKDRVN